MQHHCRGSLCCEPAFEFFYPDALTLYHCRQQGGFTGGCPRTDAFVTGAMSISTALAGCARREIPTACALTAAPTVKEEAAILEIKW
jgi:hypothetical protein